MESEYWAVCEVCETETQVLVIDSEEVPVYCSMCGESVDFEQLEDE